MRATAFGRNIGLVGVGLALALTLTPTPSIGRTVAGHAARAAVSSEVLSFDRLPGPAWYAATCSDQGSASVAHGLIDIDSPDGDCREFVLYAPHGVWNQQARNARGWIVEAALRLDPSSDPLAQGGCLDGGGVLLWMADDRELIQVHIAPDGVCLSYPETELASVDTTSAGHVYRVEAKGRIVRVYVDGQLVIDHTLSTEGGGTRALVFGDGVGSWSSDSQWDYLRYQTRPGFKAADWVGSEWPTGTPQARAARLP